MSILFIYLYRTSQNKTFFDKLLCPEAPKRTFNSDKSANCFIFVVIRGKVW